MAYRKGDPTETFEGKILWRSAKSYLVELTLGGKYFVPKSQIVEMEDPDIDGNIQFEVTEWWWGRKEEVKD